jgi:ATP-dependent RNA helicase DDX42
MSFSTYKVVFAFVFRIAVGRTGESSEHVQQHIVVLPSYVAKKEKMLEMLPTVAKVGRTLVFVATRTECEELFEIARAKTPALWNETLHVEKHQSNHNAAHRALSKGELSALIATDVAA